jgi:hypothetical protein
MAETMSDTHRRYRAIKRSLLQTLPARGNSHHEKAINTLAALICGIVGAQHTQLPKLASKAPCTRPSAPPSPGLSFREKLPDSSL